MEKRIFVRWFDELGENDASVVGKKCAYLGEMTRLGFNVPQGFAITLALYEKFLHESGLRERVARYIRGLDDLEGAGLERFQQISSELRSMIENQPMPESVSELIYEQYDMLCEKVGIPDVPVSVRSAGVESRPGIFDTYLNIKGKKAVGAHVQKVWASTFNERAIAFRISKGLAIDCDMLGVAIVRMVNAMASGICFTIDPVLCDDSKVIIEANWGLGEGVVSGIENVDRWVVDKQTLKIVERLIGRKTRYVVNMKKGAGWKDVPIDKQNAACLTDEEIKGVAEVAIHMEQVLGHPQDIEWALDQDTPSGKNIFLLQTRSAKCLAKKTAAESKEVVDRLIGFTDLTKVAEKIKGIAFKF